MVDDEQILREVVATHTVEIRQIREVQGEVRGSLTRIEDKIDRSAASQRWTPGAKATVIAATITTMGGLIAMAVLQGGPT